MATQKELAYAMKRLQASQLAQCLDGNDLSSRPTRKQWEIFRGLGKVRHRYVRCGNQSGKSAAGRREVAWLFLENHPEWQRPEKWGSEPLQLLVLGRVGQQIEESLWKGIKTLLPEGSYKEVRASGSLQRVVNTKNGNTIIFISHENANQAAERAQSYSAHYVWLDEMPSTWKLVEELHRRVQAKSGFFLFTLTPKVVNQTIRKHIDNVKGPLGHVYRMHMFDNPIYTDEMKEEIMQSLDGYSDTYKATILEGEWSMGEEMVYQYDPTTMRVDISGKYSPGWRHVLGVDPALKSKLGYTVWAENPKSGHWFNVKASYIEGIYNPTECVQAVEDKVEGLNIVKRVSDTEPWYIGAAGAMGYKYSAIYKKANRKKELMKAWQEAIGSTMFLTEWSGELEDEISSCRWSEKAEEKIVNSSSFHIIDTCHYVRDVLPRFVPDQHLPTWQARLEASHDKRKRKVEIKKRQMKQSYRSLFV